MIQGILLVLIFEQIGEEIAVKLNEIQGETIFAVILSKSLQHPSITISILIEVDPCGMGQKIEM
ncbi:MAG: hypothetical protein DBP01_02185, partial [gamma proteobacterium symbiont of Ctena orbiculata]